MKLKNTLRLAVAGVILVTSSTAFGQKKTETDAALSYQAFEKSFAAQDMVNAKKSLLKAKGFIDQAAVNAETQNSPKTLFFKGEIYASIALVRGIAEDADFKASTPADGMEIAVAAYNKAYTSSDKYDEDIVKSVDNILMAGDAMAKAYFDAGKYSEASEVYAMNANAGGAINRVDTIYYYFAAISAQNAKDWPNTAKYYRKSAELNYKPEETYLNAATAYISAGQQEEALKFLEESITKAPKNKWLYYVLGTIYMDEKNDEKVESYLNQAIVIDPQFADALYNLGSYFYTKGIELRRSADEMTDRKLQAETQAESVVLLNKAMGPLEAYVALVPNEREVLKSLWQISRVVKDAEKEAKYKKLMDEAK